MSNVGRLRASDATSVDLNASHGRFHKWRIRMQDRDRKKSSRSRRVINNDVLMLEFCSDGPRVTVVGQEETSLTRASTLRDSVKFTGKTETSSSSSSCA